MRHIILMLFFTILASFVYCNDIIKEISVHDFTFDGPLGSEGARIKKVGENHFKVLISHAPHHPEWSNMLQFKITKNAKGNTLRLDVVHEGKDITYSFRDYFSSWSYVGINWQPIHWQNREKSDSAVKGSLFFTEFKEDAVFFGHQVPMSYQDVERMVKNWKENTHVTLHTLGKSLGNRNIYRLEITDKKSKQAGETRWSHYFMNQHPREHNAQWRMVGMIEWLLSEEGEPCRKASISHFILMSSPDAPSKGWYRVNAQWVDMNRSYLANGSDPAKQPHEAYICQKDLEDLMESAYPITDIWGMHTWGGMVEPIIQPGHLELLLKIMKLLRK